MLIETYKIYRDFRRYVLKKWLVEKSEQFDMLKNQINIDEIIMSETYPITKIDIVLLMFRYKLPITILHQAKQKIKVIRIITKHPYGYYIKMKGNSIFMLHVLKSNYKIYHKDFTNDEFINKILNINTKLNYYFSNENL